MVALVDKMFLVLEKNSKKNTVSTSAHGVVLSCSYNISSLFGFRLFKVVSSNDRSTFSNTNVSLSVSSTNFFGLFVSLFLGSLFSILVAVLVASRVITSFSCFYFFSELANYQVNLASVTSSAPINTLVTDSFVLGAVIYAAQSCLV